MPADATGWPRRGRGWATGVSGGDDEGFRPPHERTAAPVPPAAATSTAGGIRPK